MVKSTLVQNGHGGPRRIMAALPRGRQVCHGLVQFQDPFEGQVFCSVQMLGLLHCDVVLN